MVRSSLICLATVGCLLPFGGCQGPVNFPLQPVDRSPTGNASYDVDGDGKVDFVLIAGPRGRITQIGYDDGKGHRAVDLDKLRVDQCMHVAIILDGLGYDIVRNYVAAGNLRLFHRPSRVICCYPSMTDMAIQDLTGGRPVDGFEAVHFDRQAGKLVGGSDAYLKGTNQPYNRLMDYRADPFTDALGYVAPWTVFLHEVGSVKKRFDTLAKSDSREMLTYLVGTAGVGTAQGANGQRRCLQHVQQLILQLLYETEGRVKFTLMSDHGHSYTESKRTDLEGHLRKHHWRLRSRLDKDRDVVAVSFGLVTYAAFVCRQPEKLAKDLTSAEGVMLASFLDGDKVVVLGPGDTRATIEHRGGRYRYQSVEGDPLHLARTGVLSSLKANADG